jgi:hypothetical protein
LNKEICATYQQWKFPKATDWLVISADARTFTFAKARSSQMPPLLKTSEWKSKAGLQITNQYECKIWP